MNRHPQRKAPIVALLQQLPEPGQAAILAELRRVIVEGGAPPGSALPLDDIATVFAVSRIPVREAIRTLQGEGPAAGAPARLRRGPIDPCRVRRAIRRALRPGEARG